MSDYLTTLAVRTLAPPASIRPRPAAHFESFPAAVQPMGDRDVTPSLLTTGAAPRVHLHDSSSRGPLGDEATGRPDASAGVRSSQDRKLGTEERQVSGAPRRRRPEKKRDIKGDETPVLESAAAEVVGHEPSGNPPASATPPATYEIEAAPDDEPRPAPPPRRVDDGAAPLTVTPEDDRGARPEDHVQSLVARATSPAAIRSTPRSQIRRTHADRDESPHVTVTIGRVEVTAPVRESPPTDKGIRSPALGLDDYLESRERS